MSCLTKKSLLAFVILVGFGSAVPAAAEIHRETKEHRYSAADVAEVSLLNLAGTVSLKGTQDDDLVVKATVFGAGDDAEEARSNANLLQLEIEQSGKHLKVITLYPVDEYDEYVYIRDDASGGGGIFDWDSSTTTTYLDERVRVRSGGGGLAVHVDYELLIPEGVNVIFDNKVGTIHAENVNGKLRLDTSSGAIAIAGGAGDVSADTGSGEIEISDRRGNVIADTGSGHVSVRKVEGDVEADTGSGGVDIVDVTGDVRADTGSGGVDLENISGDVYADTGSGGVDGRNLQNVRELEIDTGSGSVELDGDFSALEHMMIDTGSGGVRITTAGGLNMQLSVSAGSGGVRVDLPEMQNVRTGRGEFEATIGTGKGRGVIDTGSGGVRIVSQ